MKLSPVIEKTDDGWFVGQVEELPAAIFQGRSMDVIHNLEDVVNLLHETIR